MVTDIRSRSLTLLHKLNFLDRDYDFSKKSIYDVYHSRSMAFFYEKEYVADLKDDEVQKYMAMRYKEYIIESL